MSVWQSGQKRVRPSPARSDQRFEHGLRMAKRAATQSIVSDGGSYPKHPNSYCPVSNMPMLEPNYPIWSIWTQLSFVHRLYWLLLSLVGAYVLFSAAVIWARLRSRIAHPESGRLSLGMAMLGTLSLDLSFGANVFLVLLVLHSAQWFVSARVWAAQRHLDV